MSESVTDVFAALRAMTESLERFRLAAQRAEEALDAESVRIGIDPVRPIPRPERGPSPIQQAMESIGRAATEGIAAGVAAGSLAQLGILPPSVSASVDMAIDHERAVERRTRFLPQLEPEPLRRGPNGGIVLPLFGGVELPPFVRRVDVSRDMVGLWAFEITLYGRNAGSRFRVDAEHVFIWENRRSERQRFELRRRFLGAVSMAVDSLERAERPAEPLSPNQRRVFLQDAATGRERELTGDVLSLGFRVPDRASRPSAGAEEGLKCSKELLLSCLSPDQRREFKNNDCAWFTVAAPSGKKYRIESSHVFNVKELETGTWYCAQPADSPPLYDCMLAQKLWLETDEEAFLKAANVKGSGSWVRDMEIVHERNP